MENLPWKSIHRFLMKDYSSHRLLDRLTLEVIENLMRLIKSGDG